MNFNKLTSAQTERLSLLVEEIGETQEQLGKAQRIVGKILRHGYEVKDPLYDNRVDLEKELGDVLASIERLTNACDLNKQSIESWKTLKVNSSLFLHHQ